MCSVCKVWHRMSLTGMMFGGLFWGSLADHSGRRAVLMWSLAMNGIGGLLSSISQVFWLFLLMRFISGVGWASPFFILITCIFKYKKSSWKKGKFLKTQKMKWKRKRPVYLNTFVPYISFLDIVKLSHSIYASLGIYLYQVSFILSSHLLSFSLSACIVCDE